MNTPVISSEEYDSFRQFLEKNAGISLGENKHYLVTSRVTRLMHSNGITSYYDLLRKLERDNRLREQIIDAMTTNETSWFRDSHPYEILKSNVIAELSKQKRTSLRIWSAACSTGQEPYSISICIQEYLKERPGTLSRPVEIIATDISPSALDEAKKGRYEEIAISRGLHRDRLTRYFERKEEAWEIKPEIKQRVSFRPLNLRQNFTALGKFDIIYCRNVLIYFSTELKKDVLARMAATLNPGGYLILGGSESMANYSDAFQMVRINNSVLYQVKNKS